MRHPAPTPPVDAPAGTIWFGGPIGWFSVAFHVTSEQLDPIDVTYLLGCASTHEQTKGVPLLREDGTVKRVPKFGRWTLQIRSSETDEWDVDGVLRMQLDRLTSDLTRWQALQMLGSLKFSVGLSLTSSNQGFTLEPETVAMLGARGIGLDFDVYSDNF